jgi:hypothetical protein
VYSFFNELKRLAGAGVGLKQLKRIRRDTPIRFNSIRLDAADLAYLTGTPESSAGALKK